MNIVFDSQIFSAQSYGGISRYFCEIASKISTFSGAEVHIAAPLHINSYLENINPKIVKGSRAAFFKSSNIFQRTASNLVGDLMVRSLKPDVVHETYYAPIKLFQPDAPRVLTIYDMIHELLPADKSKAHRIVKYKELAAKRADYVICISESTKKDAMEILGLPKEKVSVIHLGVDLMTSATPKITKSSFTQDAPYLLYVGNRQGHKNFINLLRAYATSRILQTEYKLVCFGGGRFSEDELRIFSELNLNTTRVIHVGGSDDVLSSLYADASIFVYPSLYEGFGIPPLEAMAHDCPVACSNTSSIPEVVGDAGRYFDPKDIESIRFVIEDIVSTQSSRLELINKGQQRIKFFSWDRCASETFDVYKKLI